MSTFSSLAVTTARGDGTPYRRCARGKSDQFLENSKLCIHCGRASALCGVVLELAIGRFNSRATSMAQHLRPDVRLVDPAVQAPHAWPREHQVEEVDTKQDGRIGPIERAVGHRHLGRRGQGGDASVEADGN